MQALWEKKDRAKVKSLADLLIKAREFSIYMLETERNTSYSNLTLEEVNRKLQGLQVDEHAQEGLSSVDTHSMGYFLAEELSDRLPDSILQTLSDVLRSYPSYTPTTFINELYTILDIHKHYLQYILCYIGLKTDRIMKNKLMQAEQSYRRHHESLENAINLFLSHIPIWRHEDDVFLSHIKICFDSQSKHKVLNKASTNKTRHTLKYSKNIFLCLQMRCQSIDSSPDSLGYDVPHQSNGFKQPHLNGLNGYDQDDDELTNLVVPEEDPTFKIIALNLPTTITPVELALAFRNCGIISENWLVNVEDVSEIESSPSSQSNQSTVKQEEPPNSTANQDDAGTEKETEDDENVEVHDDGMVEVIQRKGKKRGRKKKSKEPMMTSVHVSINITQQSCLNFIDCR